MQLPYVITLGGVAVGASLLILLGIRWWFQEKHRLAALVPILLSFAYGQLVILSAGSALSALGFASWLLLWGGNLGGYAGLVWGVGGNSPNVTRAHQVVLTDGGHVIVLLVTVTLVGLWLWAGKIPNWKIAFAITAGILMGLSGSVAGASAVPLGSGVNLLGAGFTGMFS